MSFSSIVSAERLGVPFGALVDPQSAEGLAHAAEQAAARAAVVAEIPHDPGTVNEARVQAFAQALGVTACPYVIVNGVTADIQKIFNLGNDNVGHYSAKHDMAAVDRKGWNDTCVERTLVHEALGHGSDLQLAVQIENGKIFSVRTGFLHINNRLKTSGHFWAEGNAQLRTGIFAALSGRVISFEQACAIDPTARYDSILPSKYFEPGAQRTFGSFCATTIELLALKDLALLDTLLQTNNDPEALVEFASRVNRISPGLFEYLNRQPYEEHAGKIALLKVRNHLFGLGGPMGDAIAVETNAFFKDKIGTAWV